MSYAMLHRPLAFGAAQTAAPCEIDLDCSGEDICCSLPDGTSSCMLFDACEKLVDQQCDTEPYKSGAACAFWKTREWGWYAEGEGPCEVDAECWPSLACCGDWHGKRYCAPKSECATKASSVPTWVYVAGAGAAALLIAAALA